MMWKRIHYLLIVLLLTSVILFFLSWMAFAKTTLDFSLVNIQDDQVLRSVDYRGKIIIVAFSSIHCKSCKKLIPALNMVLDRFQSSDCLVVGINIDRGVQKEEIKKYVTKHRIRFPVLLDGYDVANSHKVFILPTVFILAQDGKIKKKSFRLYTYKELEKELSKLGVSLKSEQRNEDIP